ncbi:MAG TPA: hypothetical protein VF181_01750 [Balneolaceae bacterium]
MISKIFNTVLITCIALTFSFLKPDVAKGQSLPLPEGVGLSVKATSYGAEIYVPISVGDHWDVGLQYTQFWKGAYFNNLPELNNTGLKARYFFKPSKTGHYLGMLISANGFEDESSGDPVHYTPVLGVSYGYEFNLVKNWLKVGFEVEGGFGAEWKGYAGAGISLGFYH